jgi:hypothetical protein
MDYLRLFEEEFGPRRNAQQTGAFAGPGVRQTVYRGFAITGGTTPDRRWKLAWTFDWSWDAFDYDFGGGPKFPRVSPAALADPNAPLDPGKGNTFDATVSVMWGPAAVLRFGATYTKSRLRRNDTHRVAYDETSGRRKPSTSSAGSPPRACVPTTDRHARICARSCCWRGPRTPGPRCTRGTMTTSTATGTARLQGRANPGSVATPGRSL